MLWDSAAPHRYRAGSPRQDGRPMETRRFTSREDAERHLCAEGFLFQGAPNRWRRLHGQRVVYAEIVHRDHGVVVVTVDRDGPP